MASAFSRFLADQRGGTESRATSCLRLRPMPTFADRMSQAGAAPEDALATPAAPAALPLTSTPTCQRQLQLFCRPQVLA